MFSDGTSLTTIIIILVSILLSMTLHEAMHAYASNWLGDDTAYMLGRLSLNPFKHIDLFTTILLPILFAVSGLPPFGAAKPVPFNPYRLRWGDYGAALVGLVGPLTNLLMAVVAGFTWQFIGSESVIVAQIVGYFCLVNVSFFVFNMIPLPPLDGSRVLYALVPEGVQKVMKYVESGGLVTIIIFMLIIFPVIGSTIGRLALNITGWVLGVPIV